MCPYAADIGAGLGVLLIPVMMLISFPPSSAFIALGIVSTFGGLFIYLAANFSLLRISGRRLRRKVLVGVSSIRSTLSQAGEVSLAIVAIVITGVDLLLSMFSTALVFTTFFLN